MHELVARILEAHLAEAKERLAEREADLAEAEKAKAAALEHHASVKASITEGKKEIAILAKALQPKEGR